VSRRLLQAVPHRRDVSLLRHPHGHRLGRAPELYCPPDFAGNTTVGSEALSFDTTGNFNTAIGDSALKSNTTIASLCRGARFAWAPHGDRAPWLKVKWQHARSCALSASPVLLGQRALWCHRRPIEIVVEQPIPTGNVGVSIDSHQLVTVPVCISHSIGPSCKLEAV
jgi:hypothetical protein